MNRKMLRPTSFDVAERAGVSQSTVTVALRNSPRRQRRNRARASRPRRVRAWLCRRPPCLVAAPQKAARRSRSVSICRPGEDRSAINPAVSRCSGSIAATATSARGLHSTRLVSESEANFPRHFVASGARRRR